MRRGSIQAWSVRVERPRLERALRAYFTWGVWVALTWPLRGFNLEESIGLLLLPAPFMALYALLSALGAAILMAWRLSRASLSSRCAQRPTLLR